jgi:antitoxin CptB
MAGLDETVTDPIAVRKRRLRFRCWHRGTKELDLLMGPFADRFLDELTITQLGRLEDLLTTPDLDLYNWITRREPVPPAADSDVLQLIIKFHHG